MIVAEHLRKTFPGKGKDKQRVIAVDDVGFTAHDGQITGLLGPNVVPAKPPPCACSIP